MTAIDPNGYRAKVRSVACPECGAEPKELCRRTTAYVTKGNHFARHDAFLESEAKRIWGEKSGN